MARTGYENTQTLQLAALRLFLVSLLSFVGGFSWVTKCIFCWDSRGDVSNAFVRKRCSAISSIGHVVQPHELISENLFWARLMLKTFFETRQRVYSRGIAIQMCWSGSIFGNKFALPSG